MKNYPYSNSNCSVTNNNTQDCSLNNASMKNMHRSMNRNQLMEHINQVSFAVDEVKLYLDTHPCDSEALAYFHEMSAHRNDALKQYASAYGPLTVDTADYSMSVEGVTINMANASAGGGVYSGAVALSGGAGVVFGTGGTGPSGTGCSGR